MLPLDQAGSLRGLWNEFEDSETPDALSAIDRFQPILLNHAVGGGTWTDYDVDENRERGLTKRIAEGSPSLWSVAETVLADAIEKGWLRKSRADV